MFQAEIHRLFFFLKKEDSDFLCLDDSKCQVHGCCVCYPMKSV